MSRSIRATLPPGRPVRRAEGREHGRPTASSTPPSPMARARRWSTARSTRRTCWCPTPPPHCVRWPKSARDRGTARRVAVTGSVGKTGVKEAIFAALDRSSRGAAHRSVRSYNNHVGVPLSLARMPARARFGVFEMGMNQAGEIAALTRIARPHVAVVTTIAPRAYREPRQHGGDRRRQGGDLRRARTRRHGGDSRRQPLLRPAARCSRSGGRAHPLLSAVRRTRSSACSTRSRPAMADRW